MCFLLDNHWIYMYIYVAHGFGFHDGFEFQASSLHVLNILVKLDYREKKKKHESIWVFEIIFMNFQKISQKTKKKCQQIMRNFRIDVKFLEAFL